MLQKSAFQDIAIDGADDAKEGVWKFTNGRAMKWTGWTSGEPSNDGGKEHFATLCSFRDGFWNDVTADKSIGYIVEWDGRRASLPEKQPDDVAASDPRLPKADPKAYYHSVIGRYMEYEDSKPLPLINLQLPTYNLWKDEYAAKFQNVVRSSLAYRGSAVFFAPHDGDFAIRATNMGVEIDGVKLSGFRDTWNEQVTLRKGLHTIVLTSHTHGQPFLKTAAVQVIDSSDSARLLPLMNLWAARAEPAPSGFFVTRSDPTLILARSQTDATVKLLHALGDVSPR